MNTSMLEARRFEDEDSPASSGPAEPVDLRLLPEHTLVVDQLESECTLEPERSARHGELAAARARDRSVLNIVRKYREHPQVRQRVESRRNLSGSDMTDDPTTDYLNEIDRYPLLSATDEYGLFGEIDAGVELYDSLDDKSMSSLTPEQEAVLIRLAGAHQILYTSNLRLVVARVRKYANLSELKLLDLAQEGNIGLDKAIRRFDRHSGNKLSTFAVHWIRATTSRAIADTGHSIRLPVHLHDAVYSLARKVDELENAHGGPLSDEQVADQLGMPTKRVTKLRALVGRLAISLNQKTEEGDEEIGNLIDDKQAMRALEGAEASAEMHMMLRKAGLSGRQYKIIALRYGMHDGVSRTLEEVGRELEITRERVRQLEQEALTKLRIVMGVREFGKSRNVGY